MNNKDYFVKLCLGVYGVTNLFPSEEPLKIFLREKANEILADCFLLFSEDSDILSIDERNKVLIRIVKNTNVMDGYFEVSKGQHWVDEKNFTILSKEYNRIKGIVKKKIDRVEKKVVVEKSKANDILEEVREIETPKIEKVEKIKEKKDAPKEQKIEKKEEKITEKRHKKLSERSEKIFEIIKDKDRTQVQELKEVFPDISKRTLRRDIDFLLGQNMIERIGEGRDTFYIVKKAKPVLA